MQLTDQAPELPQMPTMETPKKTGNSYYDATWRWIEDTYLKYFGENRTSYGAKESLKQTEIPTGQKDIDGLQRTVGTTVGDLFSEGHIAGGVGQALDTNVLKGNV